MTPTLQYVHFLLVAGFYVGCNFMPLWMLLSLYLIVTGSSYGYFLLVVFIVDLMLPLKMPGLNATWCDLTNETEGK